MDEHFSAGFNIPYSFQRGGGELSYVFASSGECVSVLDADSHDALSLREN